MNDKIPFILKNLFNCLKTFNLFFPFTHFIHSYKKINIIYSIYKNEGFKEIEDPNYTDGFIEILKINV